MNAKSPAKFTPLNFTLRWLFATCLVLLTYNPSTYSYFHWVRSSASASELGPEHALVGVILFIGWAMFVRVTFRSLGVNCSVDWRGFFRHPDLAAGRCRELTAKQVIERQRKAYLCCCN